MIGDDKKKYTVTKTIPEAPGVVSLELLCEGGTPLYIPGQFITVYLPELGTPEGKAYSISSAHDEPLRITVEERGEFSHHLCALKPGDTFLASDPSGYFYSESGTSTLVMLAAGIGIAPFRSVILESLKKNPARRIVLLYSSRTMETIVFRRELESLQQNTKRLKCIILLRGKKSARRSNKRQDIRRGNTTKQWGMHPSRSFLSAAQYHL